MVIIEIILLWFTLEWFDHGGLSNNLPNKSVLQWNLCGSGTNQGFEVFQYLTFRISKSVLSFLLYLHIVALLLAIIIDG